MNKRGRKMNIQTFIELDNVYIEWDFDENSIDILGVWLESADKEDLEITDYLSPREMDKCRDAVVEVVEKAASRVEAWEEERPRPVAPGAALNIGNRALKAEGVGGVK